MASEEIEGQACYDRTKIEYDSDPSHAILSELLEPSILEEESNLLNRIDFENPVLEADVPNYLDDFSCRKLPIPKLDSGVSGFETDLDISKSGSLFAELRQITHCDGKQRSLAAPVKKHESTSFAKNAQFTSDEQQGDGLSFTMGESVSAPQKIEAATPSSSDVERDLQSAMERQICTQAKDSSKITIAVPGVREAPSGQNGTTCSSSLTPLGITSPGTGVSPCEVSTLGRQLHRAADRAWETPAPSPIISSRVNHGGDEGDFRAIADTGWIDSRPRAYPHESVFRVPRIARRPTNSAKTSEGIATTKMDSKPDSVDTRFDMEPSCDKPPPALKWEQYSAGGMPATLDDGSQMDAILDDLTSRLADNSSQQPLNSKENVAPSARLLDDDKGDRCLKFQKVQIGEIGGVSSLPSDNCEVLLNNHATAPDAAPFHVQAITRPEGEAKSEMTTPSPWQRTREEQTESLQHGTMQVRESSIRSPSVIPLTRDVTSSTSGEGSGDGSPSGHDNRTFCEPGGLQDECGVMHPKSRKRKRTRVEDLEPGQVHVCSFEDCQKKFAKKYNLKIHERRHRGDLPFICEQCGKKFMWHSSFERHLRVHEAGAARKKVRKEASVKRGRGFEMARVSETEMRVRVNGVNRMVNFQRPETVALVASLCVLNSLPFEGLEEGSRVASGAGDVKEKLCELDPVTEFPDVEEAMAQELHMH